MSDEKVTRNGETAVLVSGGYGAGFTTWTCASPFEPEVVEWVESGKPDLDEETRQRWEDSWGYLEGLNQLEVYWVPVGTRFEIDEYDGSESLRVLSPDDGYVA